MADKITEQEDDVPISLVRHFLQTPSFWLVAMLAATFLFFAVSEPDSFATSRNLRNILYDSSGLLLISIGMTYVIITGGIDLSPGAVLVFAQIVSANALVLLGLDGWAAVVIGMTVALVTGCIWGAINGVLVAYADVPALVVTLGTLGMAGGGALILTNGLNVAGLPPSLTAFGQLALGDMPIPVLLVFLLAVIAAVVLGNTRYGRYTLAIGSRRTAAQRAGIRDQRHIASIYLMSGGLAGLAGFLEMARFGSTSVTGHSTDALNSVAAVVIGGTSLFGGAGTIVGTVIGVFIPATLRNGFLISGVGAFWQQAVIGALLVAAVFWDQRKRKKRSGSR